MSLLAPAVRVYFAVLMWATPTAPRSRQTVAMQTTKFALNELLRLLQNTTRLSSKGGCILPVTTPILTFHWTDLPLDLTVPICKANASWLWPVL